MAQKFNSHRIHLVAMTNFQGKLPDVAHKVRHGIGDGVQHQQTMTLIGLDLCSKCHNRVPERLDFAFNYYILEKQVFQMHSNRTEAQFFSLSANLVSSGCLYLRFAVSSFRSSNLAKMEIAKEPLLLISPSSFEKHQTDTTIHMARQRTILQIVTSIVLTESIWHLLYISALFYTSSLIPPPANFDSDLNAKWFKVHANIDSVLNVEFRIFAFVFLVRQCFDAYFAIRVRQKWMRPEDRGRFRLLALVLQLGNVIVSVQFVFWPFICQSCGHTSPGPTQFPKFKVQSLL